MRQRPNGRPPRGSPHSSARRKPCRSNGAGSRSAAPPDPKTPWRPYRRRPGKPLPGRGRDRTPVGDERLLKLKVEELMEQRLMEGEGDGDAGQMAAVPPGLCSAGGEPHRQHTVSSSRRAAGDERSGSDATLDGHMSCGLGAPDGQPFGLTTAAWTTLECPRIASTDLDELTRKILGEQSSDG